MATARVHASTASERDTTNVPAIAPNSIPPSRADRAATGTPHIIIPMIGPSRAASFPHTISTSERSVISMCISVPRARSMQIDPAAAAGAASMTSDTWIPAIV
jgi:hypothetical protein